MFGLGISPFAGSRGGISFGDWGNGWSKRPNPIVAYDFVGDRGINCRKSDFVVNRNSEAYVRNGLGIWEPKGVNVLPQANGTGLVVGEQRTNSIRNPRGSGAVAGSPGTAPTNWTINTGASLAQTIVGTGVEDGLPYVDVQYAGTASSGTTFVLDFETTTGVAAANGQTWIVAAFVRVAAGSTSGVSVAFQLSERNSGGTALAVAASSALTISSAALGASRFSFSRTNTNASTAYILPRLQITPTNGAAIDITLRIAAPSIMQSTFDLSPILNADGATSSATTQPADVVYLPLSGVGTEYTVYAETGVLGSHVSNGALVEMWASGSDRIRHSVGASDLAGTVVSGGAVRSLPNVVNGSGVARRAAIRVSAGNLRLCQNGVLGAVDAGAAPLAAPTRAYMGSGGAGAAAFLNDNLRRFEIYPALSDAELQAITAA